MVFRHKHPYPPPPAQLINEDYFVLESINSVVVIGCFAVTSFIVRSIIRYYVRFVGLRVLFGLDERRRMLEHC